MADIFAELDDALRQERMERLWKEHGPLILGLVAAIILATAAMAGFRAWNDSVNTKQTAALISLLEAPSFPQNIRDIPDLRGGLRGIAWLRAAGAFLGHGKTEDALALYEKAATDKAAPDDLRQLAILRSVRLLSDKESPDAAALVKRLESVWSDNSPWRHEARLEAALIEAHSSGDFARARAHLKPLLKEPALAPPLLARARALDHIYTLRQREAGGKDR